MTQNVFGNNGRRKLDFKIGVVGEAFNQVHVNGLPIKIKLFNQEVDRQNWPWPVLANRKNGHGQFWRSTLLIKKFEFCRETIHMYLCLLYVLEEKTGCRRPTRQETELQFLEIGKRMRLAKEAVHCLKLNTSS